MSNRYLFSSILMVCLLTASFLAMASVAKALPIGQSILNHSESTRNDVIEIKRLRSGARIYLPVGPSSTYYNYSYYYSRGYYPTHIGGYVYYNPKTYNPDHDEAGYGGPYSAKERCDRRFRSFEWETGLYTTYSGYKRLCPYLR